MSLIDLSAAPAAAAERAEQQFHENLQKNALGELFAILNGNLPPEVPLAAREARQAIQMEGMAVLLEFLALQCGIAEHPTVVALREQIQAEVTRIVQAIQEAVLAARAQQTLGSGEGQAI